MREKLYLLLVITAVCAVPIGCGNKNFTLKPICIPTSTVTRTPVLTFTPIPTSTPQQGCQGTHMESVFSDAAVPHGTYYEVVTSYPVPVDPPLDGNGNAWNQAGYMQGAGWAGIMCIGIPQPAVAALPQAPLGAIPGRSVWCNAGTADANHADWIAPPLPPDPGCTPGYPSFQNGDHWFLRREFTLDRSKVVSARIQVAVDNMMDVFIDGNQVFPGGSGYYATQAVMMDILPYLAPGNEHVVAFRVLNQDSCSQTGVVYVIQAEVCGQ